MTPLFAKLIAAVLFFLIGLTVRSFFMARIYPVLSARHEAAKMRLEHGSGPQPIVRGLNILVFIGMPLLGFFVFGPWVRSVVGAP